MKLRLLVNSNKHNIDFIRDVTQKPGSRLIFNNYCINLNLRPSRNRTYILNLEGLCPNPLDDRPKLWVIQDLNL